MRQNPHNRALRRAAAFALCLLAAGAAAPRRGHAADPQPYTVTVKPTGQPALDAALGGSSTLQSLRATAPVAGFALVQRALADQQRFTTALHSFGYYKARIAITIAGHDLTDPALPTLIDDAPADPPLPVAVSFDLGPQFTLGHVAIAGPVPPGLESVLLLAPGQPALAEPILAAQDRLLRQLRQDGYPLAQVPTPLAVLRPDADRLDVTFQPQPGAKAAIGPITVNGLKDMHQSFVRRRLLLKTGQPYSPAAIDAARADLLSLGPFASVRASTADALDPDGRIPIAFDVTERPLHSVDLGIAYATDLGINLSAGWHDRNLFGNAEQLNLSAATQLGGNAVTKPGYKAGAQFLKPDFLARDQMLELDLTAVKQSLQAYDQTGLFQKVALNRKLSRHWTASLGISGGQESILQEGETHHYNLTGLPATLRYDSTNSLLDPTQGIRAALSITPTLSLGQPDATFFVVQLSGSTYLDVSGSGRSVLALRGLMGQASGVGVFAIPPDQRFYAGGGGTVRGYRYQSLGPQFADAKPTGGTAIATGSIEFRQRILDSYGVVAFLDAGQVSNAGTPFASAWRAGAGIGARYYTSFGPIRLDVAVPLNRQPGGDAFELYIGIGQAF